MRRFTLEKKKAFLFMLTKLEKICISSPPPLFLVHKKKREEIGRFSLREEKRKWRRSFLPGVYTPDVLRASQRIQRGLARRLLSIALSPQNSRFRGLQGKFKANVPFFFAAFSMWKENRAVKKRDDC